MIHFVDLTGSDKWALICDSILEKQLSDNVEMLSSFPNTGQKILEIGCSTGQITEYLSSEQFHGKTTTEYSVLCYFAA